MTGVQTCALPISSLGTCAVQSPCVAISCVTAGAPASMSVASVVSIGAAHIHAALTNQEALQIIFATVDQDGKSGIESKAALMVRP